MKQWRVSGFTLIEVAIALAILGWVLGSAVFMVSEYAAQRTLMRERFYANQVAWNQLMEQYQITNQWLSSSASMARAENGRTEMAGTDWQWTLRSEPALGKNMYRYEVEVKAQHQQRPASSLSVYLVSE